MKRLSIKLRVTLWFSAFMLLLAAAALLFLWGVGERAVSSASKDKLKETVAGSCQEITVENGELETGRLDYFNDGVYVSVYGADESLIYGRRPAGFPAGRAFEDKKTRHVWTDMGEWIMYDELYAVDETRSVWVRGITPQGESVRAFNAMLTLISVALPVMVLLAAVGGFVLTDRAFKPIRQITAAAESIESGGDLRQRINLGAGRDEIYTLAATFDRMFDRLEGSFENEKRFTSDASHELRTPVSVIIAQCEYALEHADTVEQAKSALNTVLDKAQAMSALISRLLDIARADSGQMRLSLERLNMSELTQMAAAQAQELANSRSITVSTDIQPELYITGDETMLLRLLMNLLENAVKYGRDGGHINVRLSGENGVMKGAVSDDGTGIAGENIDRVWERFFQEDKARGASNRGAGLGLPMVRYIAEAHGGSVSVKSEKGKGSEFIFTFPSQK